MASREQHHTLPLPKMIRPTKLLIVVSPYYKEIADHQVAGARTIAARCEVECDICHVPGALEIAPAIAMAERLKKGYAGYVALGCVIRGETTHYETVCNDSSRALMMLGLQGLCIGNGILTVENYGQALARAHPDQQDKGGGAAAAALHLVALAQDWGTEGLGIGFRP